MAKLEEVQSARQRQTVESIEQMTAPEPAPKSNQTKDQNEKPTKVQNAAQKMREWRRSVEYHIEDPIFVVLFLLIVYVDTMLGSWYLSGANTSDSGNTVIESLRTIILYLQCFELLLQMSIFHTRFFSHWGYAFDTLLIGGRLLGTLSVRKSTLLSFLRVWRFVRVVQAFTSIEVLKHKHSKEEWERKAMSIQRQVEREKRISKQNQDMVKMAREEIDTLREALEIAALDVAAAMKGEYHPDQTNGGVSIIDAVEYDSKGEDDHAGFTDTS